MKIPRITMNAFHYPSVAAVALMFSLPTCHGASMLIDSFVSEDFLLSLDGNTVDNSNVNSPVGNFRSSRLSNREAPSGTIMTATLDSNSGTLAFLSDQSGTGMATEILNLNLSYTGGGPYSLLGYSALAFDFQSLSGTGNLIVELGSRSDIYGPGTIRVPLNDAGTVLVPFDQLNFGATGSIDSFSAFHVTFETTSEVFSFEIGEFRAIPEPSQPMLMGVGCVLLFLRRRT